MAVESPVPETLTVSDEAALDPPATTVPVIVAPLLDGEDGEPPLHATAAIASPQHSARKLRVMGGIIFRFQSPGAQILSSWQPSAPVLHREGPLRKIAQENRGEKARPIRYFGA
jgi:hypothetical protein